MRNLTKQFYTEGITGFVGVQDVVLAMIELMASDISNQRFILVSENLSFKRVLWMIADLMHKKKPNIKVNRFMSELIWRFEYFRSKLFSSAPLLTKYTARSSVSNHPYTAEKIKNVLNFEFEGISSCIQKTVTHFRD